MMNRTVSFLPMTGARPRLFGTRPLKVFVVMCIGIAFSITDFELIWPAPLLGMRTGGFSLFSSSLFSLLDSSAIHWRAEDVHSTA